MLLCDSCGSDNQVIAIRCEVSPVEPKNLHDPSLRSALIRVDLCGKCYCNWLKKVNSAVDSVRTDVEAIKQCQK